MSDVMIGSTIGTVFCYDSVNCTWMKHSNNYNKLSLLNSARPFVCEWLSVYSVALCAADVMIQNSVGSIFALLFQPALCGGIRGKG